MKHILLFFIISCVAIQLFAQTPTVGTDLQGGVVCIVDSAKHEAIVMRAIGKGEFMSWNDAINMIDAIEDTTDIEWRLPTINELNVIFKNQKLLPNLPLKCYWSSTIVPSSKVPRERNQMSDLSSDMNSMDGNVHDTYSRSEQYVETIDFFSMVRQPFKKSEPQFVLLVREIEF